MRQNVVVVVQESLGMDGNELFVCVSIVRGWTFILQSFQAHCCMICRALESLISLNWLPWTASNMNPLSSPSKPARRLQVDLPGHVEGHNPSSPPRMQQHNLSPQKNLPKSPMKLKGSLLVAQIYLISPKHIAVRSPFNLVRLIIRYSTGGSALSISRVIWAESRL